MSEMNRLEPFDADEDLVGLPSSGDVQLLAFRRAAADELRVELLAIEQPLEAFDRRVVADLDGHVDDVADLLVENLLGQAKGGDIEAHEAAGAWQLLEH